ncbi:MAG TPA: hypothetical protein DCY12_01310 [Candidatus Atribacteria bacterium]|nr:hypothetical protein [Candidatus Atribacteria bacterium]
MSYLQLSPACRGGRSTAQACRAEPPDKRWLQATIFSGAGAKREVCAAARNEEKTCAELVEAQSKGALVDCSPRNELQEQRMEIHVL